MTPVQAPQVMSVQLCPGYRKPMIPVAQVEAIQGVGLRGDIHALPDSPRQVLLIELETLTLLHLLPGEVKENLTVSGIELMKLEPGRRLRVGRAATLEITKPCSPCSRMEEIRKGLLKELAGRRGMLARVVGGGIIRAGDLITLV